MFTWIMENMATLIISAVLLGVVTAVIAGIIRSRREGKPSCGCGCAGCPAGGCAVNGACHPAKQER